MNDPVPAPRLGRQVVHHGEFQCTDDEILHFGLVAGQLQGDGGRSEIRIQRGDDGHPRPHAGIRALPVIGIAAELSKAQPVDRAGRKRRLIEAADRAASRTPFG